MPPFIPIGLAALIAVIASMLSGGVAGYVAWSYQKAAYEAQISDLLRDQAEALTLAHQEREKLASKIATQDAAGIKRLQEAQNENDRLAAAVRTGAVRLRIAAKCPAVPIASTGASMGDAEASELAPDARPDYLALREGIVLKEVQLSTCQDILAAERYGAEAKEAE